MTGLERALEAQHVEGRWILAKWIEGELSGRPAEWRLFRWSTSYSIHGLGGAWLDIYGGCYGDMHLGEWCETPEGFQPIREHAALGKSLAEKSGVVEEIRKRAHAAPSTLEQEMKSPVFRAAFEKESAALKTSESRSTPGPVDGLLPWRGPWTCRKCERIFDFPLSDHNRGLGICLTDGKPSQMVPYERRAAPYCPGHRGDWMNRGALGARPVEAQGEDRREGHSKLVYNKVTRTIDKIDLHPAVPGPVMQAVKLCTCEIITGGQMVDDPSCPFHHAAPGPVDGLLPCPFCGGPGSKYNERPEMEWRGCPRCDVWANRASDWNRRAAPAPTDAVKLLAKAYKALAWSFWPEDETGDEIHRIYTEIGQAIPKEAEQIRAALAAKESER